MHLKRGSILEITVLILIIFSTPGQAASQISDFYSDFTTADVTINPGQDFSGKAIFELFYSGESVESQEVPIKTKVNEPVSKVIIWKERPQHDFYTAKVSLYEDNKLLTNASYYLAYGTATLPGFQVVDFSSSNSGVQLLLRSFNPTVADIKIELLDNHDIIYSKTEDDVSLTTSSELKIAWPFLLKDGEKYIVRAKINSHRLNAPALINTYVSEFTASDDVEILPADVQVDEYGASVTLRGKSQVPFDGFIVVSAKNKTTQGTQVFSQQVEDILTSGKESTAGIVWKGIPPGTYDVMIQAVNLKNITIDRYETVFRIPETSVANLTTSTSSAPGFEAVVFLIALLLVFRRTKGV